MKMYASINGKLTINHKTCTRVDVLEAITTNGNAWGVVDGDGKLIVVNRTRELAMKWTSESPEARYGKERNFNVVPVFPTKGEAVNG